MWNPFKRKIKMPEISHGWKINKHTDDTFRLDHPQFKSVTHIVSFDEACRLRKAFEDGGETFLNYIRGYEIFIEEFRKRMR